MISLLFLIVARASIIQILQDLSNLTMFTTQPITQSCPILKYDMIVLDQNNPTITFSYPISQSHYLLYIYIDYLLLGQWQGEQILILNNNIVVDQFTYIQTKELDQGFICTEQEPQRYITHQFNFSHIDNILSLQFNFQKVDGASVVEFPPKIGIRNMQINVSECHQSCLTCSGPLETECRTCRQFALKGKTTNQCRCPINKPYYYLDQCVSTCPKLYFPNQQQCFTNNQIINIETSLMNSFDYGQNNKSSQWSFYINGTTKQELLFRYKDTYALGKFNGQEKVTIKLQNLIGHYQVRIKFNIYLFFTWAVNEYFMTIIDDIIQQPLLNTIDGFINYAYTENCSNLDIDQCQLYILEYYLNHSNTDIQIQIYSDIYKQSVARWAITQFTLDILQCTYNCDVCKNDIQCTSCKSGYLLYKNKCVVSCPSQYTIVQDNKCIEMDEETPYSEYLLKELFNTQLYGDLQTSYFNGYRHLGGLQKKQLYFRKRYLDLKPHYQIRASFKVDMLNIQSSSGTISFEFDKLGGTRFESDSNKLYQTQILNFTIPHFNQQLRIEILTSSDSVYFKIGLSIMRIVIDYCYPTCTACTGPTIDECLQWAYDPNFDKQTLTCQQSTYLAIDSCTECDSKCYSCDSSNGCTMCQDEFITSGQSCYCSKGYYLAQNDTCQKCVENCKSCFGPFESDCYEISSKYVECDITQGFQWGQECNDGNTIIRDGCSNCKIDFGWSCNNTLGQYSTCLKCPENCGNCQLKNNQILCLECNIGYFYYKNGCFKCKDGCQECNYIDECTKCSITTILPLNGKCQFCDNEKGYYEINSLCQPKCGDYRKTTEEQCDDGNLIDGDGCSSLCVIEKGFQCQNGLCSTTQNSTQLELKYQNKTTTNTLRLNFGDYPAKCDEKYLKVYLENFEAKDFKVYLNLVEQDSTQFCQISFKFYRNVREYDVIHVLFYKSLQRLLVEFDELIIQARSETYYSDEDQQYAETVTNMQNNFVSSLYFIGPATIFLGGFNFFFSVLDILAWLNNFYYINVLYPPNVNVLFLNPAWQMINPFDYTPIQRDEIDADYIESPFRFEQKGVDPYFLNNMMMCFVQWGLCMMLYPLCKGVVLGIERIYQRSPKQRIRIVQTKQLPIFHLDQNLESQQPETETKVETPRQFPSVVQYVYDNAYNYQISFRAIMIKQLNLIYLDLCMASILQLQYINKLGLPLIFSQILLSIFGLSLCFAIFFIAIKVSQKSTLLLKTKQYQFDYGTLYEGIDIESEVSKLYFSISFARKMLFIVFLVGLYYYPLFQTTFCCAASFLNLMLLLYKNPFESKIEYLQNTAPDAAIFFVLVLCVVLAFDDKEQKYSPQQRTQIGWAMLSFIGLSVLVQLGLIVRQMILDAKENLQWLKSKLCDK